MTVLCQYYVGFMSDLCQYKEQNNHRNKLFIRVLLQKQCRMSVEMKILKKEKKDAFLKKT